MNPDFRRISFSYNSFPTMLRHNICSSQLLFANRTEYLKECFGSTTRSIFFPIMMHFQNFDIETWAKSLSYFANKPKKGVYSS